MRTTRALTFLLSMLTACATGPKADGDTDAPIDTDVSSDTDLGPSAATWNAVVMSLEVASPREGIDLDGDGAGDNALAVVRLVVNPLLEDAMATAERVVILQVSDVQGATDAHVGLSTFSATDADATGGNNAGATFDAGAAVGSDGVAVAATDSALTDGAYAEVLASEEITLGAFAFQAATGLHFEGTATANANQGRFGMAIRVAPLTAALEAAGQAEVADTLAALADIDSDEDGAADAISATFTFDASAASVE